MMVRWVAQERIIVCLVVVSFKACQPVVVGLDRVYQDGWCTKSRAQLFPGKRKKGLEILALALGFRSATILRQDCMLQQDRRCCNGMNRNTLMYYINDS